jgi:hypothetical protein
MIYGQTKRIDERETGEFNSLGEFCWLPNKMIHAVDLHAEVDPENATARLEWASIIEVPHRTVDRAQIGEKMARGIQA